MRCLWPQKPAGFRPSKETRYRHKGEKSMTVQGSKRYQKPVVDSVKHDLENLISMLGQNCFVRGFGIGTVCATVFWALYLW